MRSIRRRIAARAVRFATLTTRTGRLAPRVNFDRSSPTTTPTTNHLMRLLLLFLLMSVSVNSSLGQQIVAHRGASHDAPENTLAAFRLAWEQGADAIEGDFYLTSDQEIVCIHDKTTRRVAPRRHERNVAKSTLAELRELEVGSWKAAKYQGERIPTLSEVLKTVPPQKKILVEIKCGPEILPVLRKQLAASDLKPEQIIIISFNEAVIRQIRQTAPQYRANWLTGYRRRGAGWSPSRDEVLAVLKRCGATGLGTHGDLRVIDQAFVDALRAAAKEFHVWTINDASAARKFKALGADSITTDRPEAIRRAIDGKE